MQYGDGFRAPGSVPGGRDAFGRSGRSTINPNMYCRVCAV